MGEVVDGVEGCDSFMVRAVCYMLSEEWRVCAEYIVDSITADSEESGSDLWWEFFVCDGLVEGVLLVECVV